MSDTQPARVSVRILEKEYFIACAHDERTDLLDSAEYLNGKMREIRDSGKVVGLDRIAVIAALNMAHELIKARGHGEGGLNNQAVNETNARLKSLRERVEAALEQGQLEL